MTNNNHPMLPTQEQLTEWDSERFDEGENFDVMMIKAFPSGADQELDACCEWLDDYLLAPKGAQLRDARRFEPPSLKEQALAVVENSAVCDHLSIEHAAILRRALEALPS